MCIHTSNNNYSDSVCAHSHILIRVGLTVVIAAAEGFTFHPSFLEKVGQSHPSAAQNNTEVTAKPSWVKGQLTPLMN